MSWIADIRGPTVAISHGLFGRLVRGVYAGLSRREMLELPVPQDGFYRLCDGEFHLVGVAESGRAVAGNAVIRSA